MDLFQRIELLSALGKRVLKMTGSEKDALYNEAYHQNNWFTAANLDTALAGIGRLLEKDDLVHWAAEYELNPADPKAVGIVMAGNLPLVGFHDLLSVVISGHIAVVKLSSKDQILPKWIIEELFALEPSMAECIRFEELLNRTDAIIATGSDNSARYFEYYFSKMPHIIRKNRSSCAILTGEETSRDIDRLGFDMFSYFGLGCRNVSKLYVPQGYDFTFLLSHLSSWDQTTDHHKYRNNYDYNKSIFLVNGQPHLDTGFLLLKESRSFISPVSVIFYQFYSTYEELTEGIREDSEKIQCIVGNKNPATVRFGQTQYPHPWDYADGIDTLSFLSSLN